MVPDTETSIAVIFLYSH